MANQGTLFPPGTGAAVAKLAKTLVVYILWCLYKLILMVITLVIKQVKEFYPKGKVYNFTIIQYMYSIVIVTYIL